MPATSTTAFNPQQLAGQRRDALRNERRVHQTDDRRLDRSAERDGTGTTNAGAALPDVRQSAMAGVDRHRPPAAVTSGVAGPTAFGGQLEPDTQDMQDTRFWRGTLRYWSLPVSSLQK